MAKFNITEVKNTRLRLRYFPYLISWLGGAVASWLVCSTADRVVRVRVLAGDIVLCFWPGVGGGGYSLIWAIRGRAAA